MNKIANHTYYIGVNDHQIDLFEGQYRVPNGMAYNSYVIIDEKIAVLDTVDIHFENEWLSNVKEALNERMPDYLIIQHMEPDHSASILTFLEAFPHTTIVGNIKTFAMIKQFFPQIHPNQWVVKENDTLELGKHTLRFIMAPMVHWPEVMVTYDEENKILYSADGFGKFGALDCEENWINEARRYYIGIVGKYGVQVQNLLKKVSLLDIQMICPLHGPILSDKLGYYINLYMIWSSYEVEEEGILVAYNSVYGHTKEAVFKLEKELKLKGCKQVELRDLARSDMSEVVSLAFKYPKLVLASLTYNGDVFPYMNTFIEALKERNYQNRVVAIIENGTWAPMAAKKITEKFANSKGIQYIDLVVKIQSSMSEENDGEIKMLAEKLMQ